MLRLWAFHILIRVLRVVFILKGVTSAIAEARSLPGPWIRNLIALIRYRSGSEFSFRFDFFDPATIQPPSYLPHPSRILMVVSSLARGGAERMMIANAVELVRRGYQVRIIALTQAPQQPDYLEEVERHGLDYRYWKGSTLTFWAWWRRFNLKALRPYARSLEMWHYDWAAEVAVQIEDYRPTVVHAWLNLPTLIAGPISHLMGVPRFIGGQHDILDGVKRSWAVPYAKAFQMIESLPNAVHINVCAAGAREYERWLDLPPQSVKVIPNMFWSDSLRLPTSEEAADYRTTLGIPDGAQVVSTITRLIDAKDPLLSIETAARVAKMRPDVWFVIAGYGELADAVADRVRDLELQDRVILPGAVTDVGLLYAITDVFLLTSLAEAAPIVLLEAQSAGCAAVAADVGGIREIVVDGITARLIPSRSPDEFADAVLGILSDQDWRSRAEIAGPAFVAERFAPGQVMDSTLALYGLPKTTFSDRAFMRSDAEVASMPE